METVELGERGPLFCTHMFHVSGALRVVFQWSLATSCPPSHKVDAG